MKHLLFLLLFITSLVSAEQYTIQLEALKNTDPDPERYESLTGFGDIYTTRASDGYTRTRLGSYENKNSALKNLKNVHAAGFGAAYVTRKHVAPAGTRSSPVFIGTTIPVAKKRGANADHFDVTTLKGWGRLTPEQRVNVVYLDGVLHVKNGDEFTPLTTIFQNQ